MKKLALVLCVAAGSVLAAGCSNDSKSGDPKVAGGKAIDPRLKPADGSGGGAAASQPQGSGAVAGDK